ncbi:hypothetical protein GF373_12005 [bacterium]|nr:hypothetical protein [bacterium]
MVLHPLLTLAGWVYASMYSAGIDMKRYWEWGLVVLFLLLHGGLLFHGTRLKSPSVDEGSHLAAGLYSLQTLDFRMNREAPPLQSLICALPVALAYDVHLDFDNECWKKGIWNGSGDKLLQANPAHFHDMLQTGRLGTMILSLLLCLIIFLWSRDLWGPVPAVMVLFLAVWEPNLLAHGRLVTTDCAATLLFVLTGYLFWRFCRQPNLLRFLSIGLVLGLGWYAKHSGFVLIPAVFIGFCFFAFWHAGNKRWVPARLMKWKPFARAMVLACLYTAVCVLMALCFIWAGYGFEVGDSIEWNITTAASPLWHYSRNYVLPFVYLFGLQDQWIIDGSETDPLQIFLRNYLPAYSHWAGFAKNQIHLRQGHMGYFFGDISMRGWTAYYPVLFLVKTPLPLLLMLLGGLLAIASRAVKLDRMAWVALAVIPGLYLFVLVFLNTANIGYRHALPALPFLLILLGGAFGAQAWEKLKLWHNQPRTRRTAVIAAVALALLFGWQARNVAAMHPHYISYFNSAIGGWKNGRFIAIDSNLDWGQDLLYLKKYIVEQNPPPMRLYYFGPRIYPKYYEVPHIDTTKQKKLLPGTYAVSVTTLQGICQSPADTFMAQFRQREPDVYVTPSIYLYRVGKDAAIVE